MHGHWDTRFDKVADALADEITKGEELGAAIAVDVDGELVVDIWGGQPTAPKRCHGREDTIVNFFSCTKTLTALAALIAIDRGQSMLSPRSPSTGRSSPHNGKQDIEVRHLLSHTRAYPDGRRRSASRTSTTGRSRPTTSRVRRRGGHPARPRAITRVNYGHLIGEVIRRATGKTLKEFVRDEIAGPLEADVQIGARPRTTIASRN